VKCLTAFGILLAMLGGIVCAHFTLRSIYLRGKLGTVFGRGHLLASVHGRGIYQADLERELAESRYVAGSERTNEPQNGREAALSKLVTSGAAQARASSAKILLSDVTQQFHLLRFQFADEKAWSAALNRSDLSLVSVMQMLIGDLRTLEWVSKSIARDLNVTEDECRRFYDSYRESFFLPARLRVSHLFLAAPPETAPKIVEAKKSAIEALSVRLTSSQDFATLVAQNSEDDATKLNGGDLGYFTANRMTPDFVEAATKLHVGEVSKPVRTRLGFHILKLVDAQMPRQRTFDEVGGDIAIDLANQKRAAAVQKLMADLRRDGEYLRPR
jgi:foldase protein PrsA